MKKISHNRFRNKELSVKVFLLIGIFALITLQIGCSPAKYRSDMDKTAGKIITEKQLQATGKTSKFSIERPSDILRRKLLKDQKLLTSSKASFGTDTLEKVEHWPEKDYPAATTGGNITEVNEANKPITISLMQALQIGAYNSFDYQTEKEKVFQSALSLELERHAFRNTFVSQVQNLLSTDTTGNRTSSGTVTSGNIGVSRKFESGAEVSSALAIDLANLLTMGGASSVGLAGDASISIPLLRGSGKHIVMEPLTQAERNTIYAIWDFETYRKEFAVNVASKYLAVLQQMDSIKNHESDYRSRIVSARRSRSMADAGRMEEIEVDQAVQNELSARQQWISAIQSYKKQLDAFKTFIGLPPDAEVELDPNDLTQLNNQIERFTADANSETLADTEIAEANALIELIEPDYKNAGPYEFEEPNAIQLAFQNRFDLKKMDGKVYDAQRAAIVAADNLGAELTFLGSVNIGSNRSTVASASSDNSRFVMDRGVYSTLLTLDLPFDRTQESIIYRNSLIDLEQAARNVQTLEDDIKSEIRNTLRDLLQARESVAIQAKAVVVAQKQVKSVTMFIEAGRTELRYLLEAQDSLLEAQNSLTAAIVDYRIAELTIQREIGVLEIDENGLWKEYQPGEN